MYIIGISAFYHDSAMSLMKDGEIIFSAQEERFSRIKHDKNLPILSIRKALEFESITIQDIELICFYEKPFQKFERIIDSYVGPNSNFALQIVHFDIFSFKPKKQNTQLS